MYQPIKISLQVPKELDSATQAILTMRPPETNDVILAQKQSRIIVEGNMLDDNAEHEANLFANLTNTTREFIGSLAQYDYLQLQKAYDCFLLPIPQFAAKSALLFPSSAEASLSKSSGDSA